MVAAAGLFGLEHVYPRLGEDHARWKKMIMAISTRRTGMVMMMMVVVDYYVCDNKSSWSWLSDLHFIYFAAL